MGEKIWRPESWAVQPWPGRGRHSGRVDQEEQREAWQAGKALPDMGGRWALILEDPIGITPD